MKLEEEVMILMENNNNAEEESSLGTEEFGGSSKKIAKRKRSKRQRSNKLGHSSSASDQLDHGSNYESSVVTTTEEDENMASCLILLARSGDRFNNDESVSDGSLRSAEILINKPEQNNMETVSLVNVSNGVYECKACGKAFRSFQALGGHRASHHKKPKLIVEDDTKTTKVNSPTKTGIISYVAATNSSKMHECSICGSAFSSGQALGGHMRRHRTTAMTSAANNVDAELQPDKMAVLLVDRYMRNDKSNTNNFLASLDLNLPAPAEEGQDEDEMIHSHSSIGRFIHQQLAVATVQSNSNTSATAPALVGCYF